MFGLSGQKYLGVNIAKTKNLQKISQKSSVILQIT